MALERSKRGSKQKACGPRPGETEEQYNERLMEQIKTVREEQGWGNANDKLTVELGPFVNRYREKVGGVRGSTIYSTPQAGR